MQFVDFDFQLPDHLIARYPLQERTASRLLCLNGNSGDIEHKHFSDLIRLIKPGDLLVFNNTRVIPARLAGKKATGGKVEVLIERLLSDHQALAHIRASKSPKPGSIIILEDGTSLTVLGRQNDLFQLEADADTNLWQILESIGHMPLPPYIDRADETLDRERYQTVYSQHKGAVAAPTAGLHFSEQLIEQLQQQGVETGFVTLHVGAGTFQPVRVDRITDHQMHSEWFEVTADLVQQVKNTRARGGKVIAVGTTTVRCLESASTDGELQAFSGDTEIFIYPGYQFKMVDVLITNFHLPQSTLIMLVSAFSGKQHILDAYQQAIAEQYRFFSYGDAMYLTMNTNFQDNNPCQ